MQNISVGQAANFRQAQKRFMPFLKSKMDEAKKMGPQALDLKLPFREIEVPQGNFGLGEVEILSVSDPDALAKAGSLSCLLNQNPLSPGNPKAIFLR